MNERGVHCNRTLNLRSIRAIGFDLDYTLVHYRPEVWERSAYEEAKSRLAEREWPVDALDFEPDFLTRGLVIDLELGNIVKANRFGYVKRACHGTRMLEFHEHRRIYSRIRVDLGEPRWVFMNTFFALSEGCLYAQLVDLLDAGQIPGVLGYTELYQAVRFSLDEVHLEGQLKSEIASDPERFVQRDAELPMVLLDMQHAGKKLLLITNSDWSYAKAMMSYAFDDFLPQGTSWRDLFHLVIVMARKPSFFTQENALFEVISEEGTLRPHAGPMTEHGIYVGGHAGLIEEDLGLDGDEILFIGDHIFADVNLSKRLLRWRTGLVLRELEQEIKANQEFSATEKELRAIMADKTELEAEWAGIRVRLQRMEQNYGHAEDESETDLRKRMHELHQRIRELDDQVAPLAKAASELVNHKWGPLMRTGNDKSHLARQVERYADVYMSRVSNLLTATPFGYLRSPRGSLPHDTE